MVFKLNDSIPVVSIKSTFLDWPSPDDMAVVLYIAGCKHNCPGCQSPDLQDDRNFPQFDLDHVINVIRLKCKENRTNKVVFSGGDPIYHNEQLQKIIDDLKKDKFEICIYTGFEYDEIKSKINGFDFIKTGVYDKTKRQESKKTDFEMVLASTNQKFFNGRGKLLSKNGILKFKK